MTQPAQHAGGIQKRKSSAFKACLRCHRRKQRCIGYPVCSNCQSANASCERDTAVAQRKLAGLSKEDLLDRIDALEARLCTTGQDNEPGGQSGQSTGALPLDDIRSDARHGQDADLPTASITPPEDLNAGASQPPTMSAEQRIQAGLWPNDETGDRLLETYLESMHRRVPFFDFTEVVQLHNQRHGKLTYDRATRLQAFKLYMVYAIGATVLNLTKASMDTKAEDYVDMAELLKKSLRAPPLAERVEAALFGVLYRLRVSLDSSAWYEIGLAMRMAIELGMHRQAYYETLDLVAADWSRRLFWGVYIMERNICFSFKRPLSIAEHDINTQMPGPSTHTIPWTTRPTDSGSEAERATKDIDLSTFVAVLNLVRIKSHMHNAIHRADRDISSARPQVDNLLTDIRQFESTLPGYTGADQDFIQLHVNNATRTLIEPCLTMLDADDPLLSVCVQAAGRVCQLFKRLRLRKALGYSFTMVNSVFVAGMTMCYIVFRNTSYWTPALANDLRACSSVLYILAERNHGLRKYCDLLEVIIDGVMQHIEQTTSPNSAASTHGRSPFQEDGPVPIPFHKLKDAFKQMEFELPSNSYPGYTADPQSRVLGSPNTAEPTVPPLQHLHGTSGTAGPLENSGMGTYASMGDLYYEQAAQSAHTWDMDFLYDIDTGNYAQGLFTHEPYTQQMMGELLAQNPFNR